MSCFKPSYSPHHTPLCTALPCCCLLPIPALWSFAILPAPHFSKNIHTYREWNWDRHIYAKILFRQNKKYWIQPKSCLTELNVTGGELELFQQRNKKIKNMWICSHFIAANSEQTQKEHLPFNFRLDDFVLKRKTTQNKLFITLS